MFVSCPAARFHATSRTMCIYVYAYMYAICTRYACGSAGTFTLSLSRQRALPRTVCMRQRGHFHSFTLKAARHFQSFTHCMHAAARALSLFHSRGSAAAPGHVCMSAATVCRTAARSSLLGFAFESGGLSRAARVCGPAVLRPCGCGLCCHAVSDACARPGTAPHHLLAAATREVALEAWRWRLGAGGLALEASWPVAMRRRALGAVPPVLVALGAAWLGVACGVVSAGFGCRGPKKRRRADTEDEDTRGRPAAGSATWRHVLVRLHTRFVRCALLEHKPHELHETRLN